MRRPLFAMQRRGVQSVLCRCAVCNRIGQGILSAETSVPEIWKTARIASDSKEGVVHRSVSRRDARVIRRRGDSVSMRSAVNPFWRRLKARRAISFFVVKFNMMEIVDNIASRLEIDPGAQTVRTAH